MIAKAGKFGYILGQLDIKKFNSVETITNQSAYI